MEVAHGALLAVGVNVLLGAALGVAVFGARLRLPQFGHITAVLGSTCWQVGQIKVDIAGKYSSITQQLKGQTCVKIGLL